MKKAKSFYKRSYMIRHPDGTTETISNLAGFCRTHKLNLKAMRSHKTSKSKGFTVIARLGSI